MLKETESEETIVFFVTFLSLVAFQSRGAGPLPSPPDYVYAWDVLFVLGAQKYNQNKLAILLNFSDLP